jgi:hypothetical protein
LPLSPAALALLGERRADNIPLFKVSSVNALLNTLKANGGNGYTVHGMRTSFTEWVAAETDWPDDLADRCIAHERRSKVRKAYHGVRIRHVQDHFYIEFEMPPELVQLTKPSGLTRNTAQAQSMRNEIAELNEYFAAHELEGARHIGWVAKFHGASPDKYMLNRGGRLYSQPPMPATNYQNMPQEQRLKLRIDGEPVTEIDISASFLTIFYAAHGKRIEMNDAYGNIVGPDAIDRAIVKFWVNASFGNRSLISKWSAGLKKGFARKHRESGWTIERIELDAAAYSRGILGGNESRPGAKKGIENNLASVCQIDQCILQQCGRFHGRMIL